MIHIDKLIYIYIYVWLVRQERTDGMTVQIVRFMI